MLYKKEFHNQKYEHRLALCICASRPPMFCRRWILVLPFVELSLRAYTIIGKYTIDTLKYPGYKQMFRFWRKKKIAEPIKTDEFYLC